MLVVRALFRLKLTHDGPQFLAIEVTVRVLLTGTVKQLWPEMIEH